MTVPAVTSGPIGIDSSWNLISCDAAANKIYIHSWFTTSISSSFASPSTNIQWIALDSSWNLISCDNDTDKIYIHSWITSTISSSFASPSTSPKDLTVVNS